MLGLAGLAGPPPRASPAAQIADTTAIPAAPAARSGSTSTRRPGRAAGGGSGSRSAGSAGPEPIGGFPRLVLGLGHGIMQVWVAIAQAVAGIFRVGEHPAVLPDSTLEESATGKSAAEIAQDARARELSRRRARHRDSVGLLLLVIALLSAFGVWVAVASGPLHLLAGAELWAVGGVAAFLPLVLVAVAMRLFRTILTLGVFAVSALAQEGHEKHAYQVCLGTYTIQLT